MSSLISQPDALVCACTSASPDAGAVLPASRLVDLFGKLSLFDEPAPDARAADSLTELFEKLTLSDAAATDEFPDDVLDIDDPLPPVACDASADALDAVAFVEVMVTGHSQDSSGATQDPLRAAMQSLATPVAANADGAALEAIHVKLLDNANKMAAMKRRAEAS